MRTQSKSILLIYCIALLLVSCENNHIPAGDIVARVNDQILTQSEVSAWEASLGQTAPNPETRVAYIRSWVEEALVFEEAVKQELLNDPWVEERINEVTRNILTSRFLQIDASNQPRPSPKEIRAYYEENSDEFIRGVLGLEVEYWRSETSPGMSKLRSDLLRGKSDVIWTGDAGKLDHNRILLEGRDSTDPQVWKAITRLKEGQISSVVKINNSYWIFKLLDRLDTGEMKKLEDVEELILIRLAEAQRRKRKEHLIESLIERYRESGNLEWSDASKLVRIDD